MVVIIDYDIGNVSAVLNMFRRIGITCHISSNPIDIERAERIILPGNGAFDACMINLRSSGLVPLLERQVLQKGVPLLGICVGAQMLGHGSAEGIESGLGWLDMTVDRFPTLPGLRIPHMGWNQVRSDISHPLTKGMTEDTRFYFVHSYYMQPADPNDVFMTSHYGIEFASGVARENITGVQFHPEKSSTAGSKLLTNFLSI
jgi:glutamine amidotransferase